jgi:hypothetical protein
MSSRKMFYDSISAVMRNTVNQAPERMFPDLSFVCCITTVIEFFVVSAANPRPSIEVVVASAFRVDETVVTDVAAFVLAIAWLVVTAVDADLSRFKITTLLEVVLTV